MSPPEVTPAESVDSPPPSPVAVPQGSVRSRKQLLWTSSAYFAEGLPWSFLHQLATEYLTAIGAPKSQISSTSLFHLAVTFKFAWSPLVDVFANRRTLMLLCQGALSVGMLATAAVSQVSGSLSPFWLVLTVLSVVHSVHDIACDGLYIQVLNKREQSLFAGTRNAAYRAAMVIGSSVLVTLAGEYSWPLAFGVGAAIMAAAALINTLIVPSPTPVDASRGGGRASGLWAAYRTFFLQPQAIVVLSFMLFYRLGDIMMFAMSKPLLRDIGVGTAERGYLNGLGMATSLVASIAAGGLIARHGLARCLVPMTYLQSLAIPLYIGLAVFRPSLPIVVATVFLEQVASGVGLAANSVFLMQRCSRRFSSSHYAFATAVVSLASTLSGTISGSLNEALGHPWFFTVAFLATWPSLLLVRFVPLGDLAEPEASPPVV